MELRRFNNGSIVGGMVIVLLGVIFFLATTGMFGLHWGTMWPGFLMATGIAFAHER